MFRQGKPLNDFKDTVYNIARSEPIQDLEEELVERLIQKARDIPSGNIARKNRSKAAGGLIDGGLSGTLALVVSSYAGKLLAVLGIDDPGSLSLLIGLLVTAGALGIKRLVFNWFKHKLK